ncbi:hypothetical protein COLO4_35846 [Corchorus olitorius]|uniref:Calcineurin-like phosphoesterase domain-containing protein n=1 Tax=Corchorus olitorius TaxID=93759 RepID=A0A1R3GCR8_9ROSI|nr:hypothetical protein COLO4_35846 [Corchorus olitorius]
MSHDWVCKGTSPLAAFHHIAAFSVFPSANNSLDLQAIWKRKGTQGLLEIENPNLAKQKNLKARDVDITKQLNSQGVKGLQMLFQCVCVHEPLLCGHFSSRRLAWGNATADVNGLVSHLKDLQKKNAELDDNLRYYPSRDGNKLQPTSSAAARDVEIAEYSTDYGMFHFCIANSEHDWREGTEQYKFIENYWQDGSFGETLGRSSLQGLWEKYKVDIAFSGHVHNYERTCPIYRNQCVNLEKSHYSGIVNRTVKVVVGGGGSHLSGPPGSGKTTLLQALAGKLDFELKVGLSLLVAVDLWMVALVYCFILA